MMEAIRHACHPHELELKLYNRPYKCDGCKDLGVVSSFRCEQCNFDLHIECAHSSQTTSHEFVETGTLKFFSKPPGQLGRFCDACGRIVSGFVYHCEVKGWDLHPCCHSLPRTLKVDDTMFKLCNKVLSKCFWCKKRELEGSLPGIRGWSYVSTCKKYNLHVYCAIEMMLEEWEKEPNLRNRSEQSTQGLMEQSIHSHWEGNKREKIVMIFVITNVVLELISAVLDHVSSVEKPQCALFGMLISFAALFTCILELIYEGREKKLVWKWRGTLMLPWWYYHQDQGCKPFGTFNDIVLLVCALCQCVVAAVGYSFLRRHANNPIKITTFSIIFAFGILFSQILKNRDREGPYQQNDTLMMQ